MVKSDSTGNYESIKTAAFATRHIGLAYLMVNHFHYLSYSLFIVDDYCQRLLPTIHLSAFNALTIKETDK